MKANASAALELAKAFASNTLLAGVLAFFLVRTYYNVFYAKLGIDPQTVGLTYSVVLQSSVGLLLFIIAASATGSIVLLVSYHAARTVWSSERGSAFTELAKKSLKAGLSGIPSSLRLTTPVLVVTFTVLLSIAFWAKSSSYADGVRDGKPVLYRYPVFTTFGIRASPVDLELAPGATTTPFVDNLIHQARLPHSILYVARSDSTLVFYDSIAKRALYVPASLFIVGIVDCQALLANEPRCSNAIGG